MTIHINHQLAFLKENTSFEFISENSLFTGSDSYTLSITFPLKDCPQNLEIFGHIHRQDVEKKKVVFDCDIRDRNFFKSGSITITEISETEVKTQFLEGRSEQNFDDTFDDIYLNQLSLGYPADTEFADNPLPGVWQPWPTNRFVPLPWVNNSSGNIQNEVTYNSQTGRYAWKAASHQLSFQPYLLHILEKICEAVDYTYDFSEIVQSDYRYLLVCNTLPWTWNAHNFALALPHWSLTEFFEQLELFLYGEFTINHKAKHISFNFTTKIIRQTPSIRIDKVINEYTTEVSREEESDYLGVKNLAYAENNNRFWAYRSCEWYISENKDEAVVYDHLADLLQFAQTLRFSGYYTSTNQYGRTTGVYCRGYPQGSDGHKLFYAADVDTYFIMFCYDAVQLKTTNVRETVYHWYQYYNRLEPVNQFGRRVVDPDGEDVEIRIVPAWIDDTDDESGHGSCIFLEPGEMGSTEQWTDETDGNGNTTGSFSGGNGFGGARTGTSTTTDDTQYDDGELAQSKAGKAIAKGKQDKADAYFDCIFVAFWDGTILRQGMQPCPIIDSVLVSNDFQYTHCNYSLRLNYATAEIDRTAILSIDGKKKYNFSFLADEIPDTKAIFHINGGRYLCEKITATFTERGMSKKLKGVFYRLLDE